MIRQSLSNNLVFRYILADSWFSSAENFTYIAGLGQQFIMPLKGNRKLALSQADQQQGRYQPIGSLAIEERQPLVVWLVGVDFPLLLTKQVFKPGRRADGDRIQGTLYLVTNDLTDFYDSCNQRRIKIFIFFLSMDTRENTVNQLITNVIDDKHFIFSLGGLS